MFKSNISQIFCYPNYNFQIVTPQFGSLNCYLQSVAAQFGSTNRLFQSDVLLFGYQNYFAYNVTMPIGYLVKVRPENRDISKLMPSKADYAISMPKLVSPICQNCNVGVALYFPDLLPSYFTLPHQISVRQDKKDPCTTNSKNQTFVENNDTHY